MASRSDIENSGQDSFLAAGETKELNWSGKLNQGEEEYPAEFVATDQRLIFSFGGGHFKDIGLKHVESVEVGTDIETKTYGTNPDSVLAVGVLFIAGGLISIVAGGFSALAGVTGLTLMGVGGYIFRYGKKNYDELQDNLETVEQPVYHILLRTSATSPFSFPIYIETNEDVGPGLSKLVQESD